ncbi:MAG TPA: hypothetical protein VKH19_07155 [Gemmatimonadaceae bacterium]|nr:hypothetical protein [Gemmatimonadaceae bacterium]
MNRRAAILALLLTGTACAPRLPPLEGAPSVRVVPSSAIPVGHTRIIFRWELDDPDFAARGDGATRLASPDSARLDFFLGGGIGAGAAVLVGDELRLPSRAEDLARRLVPPAPLLWGTLGRTAVPAARDTAVRVDGDTLRADIGAPVAWRLTFVRDTLRRVERVSGARVIEWVERFADGHVRYRHEVNRRQLDIFPSRSDAIGAFDQSIWTLP